MNYYRHHPNGVPSQGEGYYWIRYVDGNGESQTCIGLYHDQYWDVCGSDEGVYEDEISSIISDRLEQPE